MIFSSFAVAYAIFEIPTAKWAETLGTKAVRRACSGCIPRFERATVQGIFFAGAHLVGGLTPALIGLMLP